MKGASEILTRKSTRYVIVHRDGANDVPGGTGVETAPIGEPEEDSITHDHILRFSDFAHHRLVLSRFQKLVPQLAKARSSWSTVTER
jgi:hypothetical protein